MAVDIYPILATICQKCEKFKARLNMLEQSMSGDIYHWLCHIFRHINCCGGGDDGGGDGDGRVLVVTYWWWRW